MHAICDVSPFSLVEIIYTIWSNIQIRFGLREVNNVVHVHIYKIIQYYFSTCICTCRKIMMHDLMSRALLCKSVTI